MQPTDRKRLGVSVGRADGIPAHWFFISYHGSSAGLDAFGGDGIPPRQGWTQSSPGVPGYSEENDCVGTALAAGDFNSDGFGDLAVGVPGEDVWNSDLNQVVKSAGGVNVIYGSTSGLSVATRYPGPGAGQIWMQGRDGVPGSSEHYDFFGFAVY